MHSYNLICVSIICTRPYICYSHQIPFERLITPLIVANPRRLKLYVTAAHGDLGVRAKDRLDLCWMIDIGDFLMAV